MAPKKSETDPTSQVKKARGAKNNNKKKKKAPSPGNNLARKERRPRVDFLYNVVAASGLERSVCQKALDALHIVVARQMREKAHCRVPNLMHLRLKILPPQAACTRLAFGRLVQIKAREQCIKKVQVSALKPLTRDALG